MNIFKKRTHKRNTKPYIPTWDEVVQKCYDQDLTYTNPIYKVFYNNTQSYRVIILQRTDNIFTILEEKLIACDEHDLSIDPDIWGYWSDITSFISFFHSNEAAEEEAQRLITNFSY